MKNAIKNTKLSLSLMAACLGANLAWADIYTEGDMLRAIDYAEVLGLETPKAAFRVFNTYTGATADLTVCDYKTDRHRTERALRFVAQSTSRRINIKYSLIKQCIEEAAVVDGSMFK